jgi:hypothetical protein
MVHDRQVRGAGSGQVPDRRVFRQIHPYAGIEVDRSRWPATVPAGLVALLHDLRAGAGTRMIMMPYG